MNGRTIKSMLVKRNAYVSTLNKFNAVEVVITEEDGAMLITLSTDVQQASKNEAVKIANFLLNRVDKTTRLNIFNYMF